MSVTVVPPGRVHRCQVVRPLNHTPTGDNLSCGWVADQQIEIACVHEHIEQVWICRACWEDRLVGMLLCLECYSHGHDCPVNVQVLVRLVRF